jgi:hypothetical protein
LESAIGVLPDAGDIYTPGDEFTETSIPNSDWWDNSKSGIKVTNINFIGSNKISFTVYVPSPPAHHYPEIPKTDWKVISAPAHLNGFEAWKAIDGDDSTMYHVPWSSATQKPHDFIIDLGKEYSIREFYYKSRTIQGPPWEGRVRRFEVFLSNDSLNWSSQPALNGMFFRTDIWQYDLLPAVASGRYLKFSAKNSWYTPWDDADTLDIRTSIAEISLRGFDPATVGQDFAKHESPVVVYPNPNSGSFHIRMPETFQGEFKIQIIDMLGRLVYSGQFEDEGQLIHTAVSLGTYGVIIQWNDKSVHQKLIISQ